ncbi:MAG: hypothetical protein PHT16_01600 [Candidatus Pacebacteria bacterium]|nr:hypothetical protein [Candidatus Paceibacterota bacterium]
MEKFNWFKVAGYGALIWVIMFAFVWLLISLSLFDSVISKIIIVLAAGVLSYLFTPDAKSLKPSTAFGYGVSWVIVGVVLDLLISMRFMADLFGRWEYWLAYALILLAPVIHTMIGETSASVSTTH